MSQPDPKCQTCGGVGMVEYVGGEFQTSGNSYTGSQTVTATPEKPVYRPCPCTRRRVDTPPEPSARRYGAED